MAACVGTKKSPGNRGKLDYTAIYSFGCGLCLRGRPEGTPSHMREKYPTLWLQMNLMILELNAIRTRQNYRGKPMSVLVDKRMKSPMYSSSEEGKQAKKNHWYVTEIGTDQPKNQCWREWWDSKGLGKGHIKWRSTCVAMGAPDPFRPKSQFKVEFHLNGAVYNLQFRLAPVGPNK